MEQIRDIQKLVQISKMYYMDGRTQESIAKEVGISRSAVSQLLTEAKNAGLVQITIKDPSVNDEALSSEFERRYGLRKCVVVPTTIKNERLVLKIVASQAAQVVQEHVVNHSSFGIAWGSACYEFMQAFPEDTNLYDITVVPLIGGSPLVSQEFQINESARQFAEKVSGSPVFMYSPGIVDSIKDKNRFLESSYMQGIVEHWKHIDYAVIGIGHMPDSYEGQKFTSENSLSHILKHPDTVVSDLCARYFNIRGEVIECSHNDRLIGIDEDGLRNAKSVSAIAVGDSKVFPIISALNTGLVHYLFTDERTARLVLDVLDSKALDPVLCQNGLPGCANVDKSGVLC